MHTVQFAVTIATAVLAAIFTAKICISRWEGNYTKLCVIGGVLSAIAAVGSVFLHGLGMKNIQTIFLFCIFLYASYGDIKTHEADDFNHILVFAVALITRSAEEIPNMLLSVLVVGGVILLAAVFLRGAGIGGADVKFTAACACLSTLEGGLWGLGLGTMAALLCNSPFRKKEGAEEGFPMLPYLSCSYMLVHLLS